MKNISLLLASVALLSLMACNQKKAPDRTDTTTSGVATVISDDCFSPFLREESNVFNSIYGDATIHLQFSNEVDAFNLLFKDSVRLIVAARDLSPEEKQSLRDKKVMPRSAKIAVDAIALIVNNKNKESYISVSDLKNIIDGKVRTWEQLTPGSGLGTIQVVFDNANSSTVRYVQDSISIGKIKSPNVFAQNNNQAVLDYVAKTPNALGIIGVNWISNPDDTSQFSFIDRIKVLAVSLYDNADADNSYLPYPAYLLMKNYPFSRDVFMIITDPPGYLPSGFMNFCGGDRGQRIILKAGLVPATRPMRLVQVHE
jgi:phosphate transport system substrate-binding protein